MAGDVHSTIEETGMLVFIRLIPESVTRQDLQLYVEQALRAPWSRLFGQRGTVKSLEILKLTDEDSQAIEFHALVDIEPPKSARLAIRRLNRTPLLGRRMTVRKYYTRTSFRDRRGQRPDQGPLSIQDRRVHDRRRPHLQQEWVHISGPSAAGVASDLQIAGQDRSFGLQ